MYLKSLCLTNVRGFENLEFDFDRGEGHYAGWTVFTGGNGSGKSTLLKAIAVGLTGADTARALQPNFRGWIRDGCKDASIRLQIERTTSDDDFTQSGRVPTKPFPAEVHLSKGGEQTLLSAPLAKGKQNPTPGRTLWSPSSRGWFSCGYGPFRRFFGASAEAIKRMAEASTGRYVTMFEEAASLSEVDAWLRNLKHKELEGKAEETQQLKLLLRILRDDLLPNQIQVERVDSDGLWLSDRNGVQLSWGEMSDGYRSALALMIDIMRHLIHAYGVENLVSEDEGCSRVNRSGIVLVDEIDAHLHPAWQRTIGFWLKKHFPKIQFLVTTHSPLICQAADPQGIFVLPKPGSREKPRCLSEEEHRKIVASRSDTILRTSAFELENTRSPVAVEKRTRLARLNAKKRGGGEFTPQEAQEHQQLLLFAKDSDDEPAP